MSDSGVTINSTTSLEQIRFPLVWDVFGESAEEVKSDNHGYFGLGIPIMFGLSVLSLGAAFYVLYRSKIHSETNRGKSQGKKFKLFFLLLLSVGMVGKFFII